MDNNPGYEANDHGSKKADNRRNCYSKKAVKTNYGEIPLSVPRDRESTFEPQVIPKRVKDISCIEDKVLSMYANHLHGRCFRA